ncbi:MAG TPA: hypothetical protein VEU30_05750 [Thermoanaerobaculia bacterium]|nr:hypothetical protein [Thermoanaerobaculia bacterium]
MLAVVACAGACGRRDAQPDHQSEWHDVLRQKQAAAAPDAKPEQKQVYADSVRAFVQKHPNHGRAREVWQRMQLEFADDLAALGRNQDAIRVYRSVLAHDPVNDHARRGLATAAGQLAVGREQLLAVEKGMSHREVAKLLGKPMPGWTVEKERSSVTIDAWYYRTRGGGIAAVYFREGKVFAAEEASDALHGRLGS